MYVRVNSCTPCDTNSTGNERDAKQNGKQGTKTAVAERHVRSSSVKGNNSCSSDELPNPDIKNAEGKVQFAWSSPLE